MAVIFRMKNARSFDPLCPVTAYRFDRIDPAAGLDIEAPCSLCLTPFVAPDPEPELGGCCCDTSGFCDEMTEEDCLELNGSPQPGCASGEFTWVAEGCLECPADD